MRQWERREKRVVPHGRGLMEALQRHLRMDLEDRYLGSQGKHGPGGHLQDFAIEIRLALGGGDGALRPCIHLHLITRKDQISLSLYPVSEVASDAKESRMGKLYNSSAKT